jgi:hypothetical protein
MLKDVETSMAKLFSVARKALSSAGSSKAQVRILGDVIILKFYAKFTGLEQMLFRFVNRDPAIHEQFYEMIYDDVCDQFQGVIQAHNATLRITRMDHRTNADLGHSVSVLYLNRDLEKLIANGQVTIP